MKLFLSKNVQAKLTAYFGGELQLQQRVAKFLTDVSENRKLRSAFIDERVREFDFTQWQDFENLREKVTSLRGKLRTRDRKIGRLECELHNHRHKTKKAEEDRIRYLDEIDSLEDRIYRLRAEVNKAKARAVEDVAAVAPAVAPAVDAVSVAEELSEYIVQEVAAGVRDALSAGVLEKVLISVALKRGLLGMNEDGIGRLLSGLDEASVERLLDEVCALVGSRVIRRGDQDRASSAAGSKQLH